MKCRPLDVAFGGKQDQDECIVSVNMDGRTILLYNLHDQENALELAFQVRYCCKAVYPSRSEGSVFSCMPRSWLGPSLYSPCFRCKYLRQSGAGGSVSSVAISCGRWITIARFLASIVYIDFLGPKLRRSRVAHELGMTGMRRGRWSWVRVPQYHVLVMVPTPA